MFLPVRRFPRAPHLSESYTDPRLFAPNDTTALPAGLGINEKVKGIGDGKLTIDLKLRSANRDVIDRAIDF